MNEQMDVGSVMEHFSILQGPAGTIVSQMGDGMTRVTRGCKSSSVEQSPTCVSGTALTRRSFPAEAAEKLCDASDPWSLQIMLCWGWFSSRKRRELSMDRWRVCQVDRSIRSHESFLRRGIVCSNWHLKRIILAATVRNRLKENKTRGRNMSKD